MFSHNDKGIALIAVIIIVAVTAIAVLGIATFISNALVLNTVRAAREQAIYAAQAGIYSSLYDYLATVPRYWVKALNVNILGNAYYGAGRDANFLLIDADNPQTLDSGGTNNLLQRIALMNINQTQAITVNQMKVEWANFGGTLDLVTLRGVNRTVSASSGQLFGISPVFTLLAQQSFSGPANNAWRFTATIPNNAIIIVTFYFTDGSTRKAYLFNNGRSGNNEFSITATGEVRGTINWKRTVEATYDVGVGRITSWQEADSHI